MLYILENKTFFQVGGGAHFLVVLCTFFDFTIFPPLYFSSRLFACKSDRADAAIGNSSTALQATDV